MGRAASLCVSWELQERSGNVESHAHALTSVHSAAGNLGVQGREVWVEDEGRV